MINKVLASTAQAFTTAEQAQARANIGAMAASASSQYYSTANPSAFISGVDHDSNLSGNGRTQPLGLNTSITIDKDGASATLSYDHLQLAYNENGPLLSATRGLIYMSGHAGNASSPYTANYGLQGMHVYGTDTYNHITATATLRYSGATFTEGTDSAKIKATGLTLHTNADGDQVVDASSVARWNSYSAGSWNESGNSLSTGWGGNQVTAASQFNDGAGNWSCRRVKMSGLPDQDLYGFRAKPNGTATAYLVNDAGGFVGAPQQNYYCKLYHRTGAVYEDLGTSFYPTGLTGNARLDFVNLCSGCSANIMTDTFHGNTATIDPGQSATMWYIASADIWTDGVSPVPV